MFTRTTWREPSGEVYGIDAGTIDKDDEKMHWLHTVLGLGGVVTVDWGPDGTATVEAVSRQEVALLD